LGDKHPDVGSSLVTLAHLDVAEKKYSDALAAAQSAAQIYTAAFSATHWRTAAAESAEGAALSGLGRYGEAEPLLARSNEILSKADAPQIGGNSLNDISINCIGMRERHAPSQLSDPSAGRRLRALTYCDSRCASRKFNPLERIIL
jgi:tetratricopeptide (TPR) repeat protein